MICLIRLRWRVLEHYNLYVLKVLYLRHKLVVTLCCIRSMNLTDNETLKFLKGGPVFLDDICAVYPATLGEIVDVGYDNF